MTHVQDTIEEIRERSAFWLAGSDQADTFSPDSLESPGAEFLDSVKRSALETWDYNPKIDESDVDAIAADQTDACVPVYTHSMWSTFIDLGAYNEDVDNYGDMGDMAAYALHLIAERLFIALIRELIEARDEDEADAEEDEEDSFDAVALEEIVEEIGEENVVLVEKDAAPVWTDEEWLEAERRRAYDVGLGYRYQRGER